MSGRKMRVATLAVAGVLFGMGTAAGTVSAAPQGPWILPASDLSDTNQGSINPQVAVAADGTITAVWRSGAIGIIQVATRPPGGTFGTPENLSPPSQDASKPQVAIAANGTITVAWERWDGTNWTIWAATRPPGGTFGTPENLSAPGQNANNSQVAIAANGTATAIWERWNGSNRIAQAATRPPGGTFGTPENLSAPGQDAFDPQVAMTPDGTATAVWEHWNGSDRTIQAATRSPGGTFGGPVNLSVPGQDAYGPQVAVAADGTTTAIWEASNGSNRIIQAATRPAGGSFGTPVNLSAPGQDADRPQVEVAPDGTTTVTWQRSNGSHSVVQASTRPPGGAFGTPVDLSAPGQDADRPQVEVAPDGTVTTVWRRYDGSNYIIQAATRPAGGTFGDPVNLSAPGQDADKPQVAVAPDGVATAVWTRNTSSYRIIQAAWTGSPPELRVTRSGTGSGQVNSTPNGIDCGTICSAAFSPGTEVTLTAAPVADSTFTGWSGACTGTAPTCQVTMSGIRELTATFGKTPVPKPSVPANPPNDNTAIYNPKTGKLKIRLKCGSRYKPKCLKMVARAVTSTGKRAKVMSSQVKVKNRGAGRWGYATLKIKPKFRAKVKNMGNKTTKTLWTRITVTWKKRGKKLVRTVHHRYRVMVR